MQSCDVRNWQIAADRKMQVSSMKMNQIELVNVLNHMIYQENFPRHGIFAALILPQRTFARRNKSCICNRIPAGKQSHIVSGANQFLSEVRDDPFRSSIVFRRHAFDKWRYLSNSHIPFLPRGFRLRRHTVLGPCNFPKRNGGGGPHESKLLSLTIRMQSMVWFCVSVYEVT